MCPDMRSHMWLQQVPQLLPLAAPKVRAALTACDAAHEPCSPLTPPIGGAGHQCSRRIVFVTTFVIVTDTG